MSEVKFEKTYKGYYFIYSDGIIDMYESPVNLKRIKSEKAKVRTEKDFEVEMMWLVERHEQDISSRYDCD